MLYTNDRTRRNRRSNKFDTTHTTDHRTSSTRRTRRTIEPIWLDARNTKVLSVAQLLCKMSSWAAAGWPARDRGKIKFAATKDWVSQQKTLNTAIEGERAIYLSRLLGIRRTITGICLWVHQFHISTQA